MRLEVNRIEYENDRTIVTGITEVGVVKGVWKYREPPVVNKGYFVELSYGKFEKKISECPGHTICASMRDDVVTFCGRVEDMDEDVYYIRFAIDWLDMIEIDDRGHSIAKGRFATFSVRYDDIGIYPYNL